jgi:hypothetical protein
VDLRPPPLSVLVWSVTPTLEGRAIVMDMVGCVFGHNMTVSQRERLARSCILSPAGSVAARIHMKGERKW